MDGVTGEVAAPRRATGLLEQETETGATRRSRQTDIGGSLMIEKDNVYRDISATADSRWISMGLRVVAGVGLIAMTAAGLVACGGPSDSGSTAASTVSTVALPSSSVAVTTSVTVTTSTTTTVVATATSTTMTTTTTTESAEVAARPSAPSFSGDTLDGAPVSLQAYAGRPLVLVFWSSG